MQQLLQDFWNIIIIKDQTDTNLPKNTEDKPCTYHEAQKSNENAIKYVTQGMIFPNHPTAPWFHTKSQLSSQRGLAQSPQPIHTN